MNDSEVRELEGQLVYHDGLRQWFELKLDQPQCGHISIQIVARDQVETQTEILRNCRVRLRGKIDSSPTGYYSRAMYQDAQTVEPIGKCQRQAPFPDYSKAKPDSGVRAYRVNMIVDNRPGDHPIIFRVTSAGKQLRPWQAYAKYFLNGSDIFYGRCGQGFAVSEVFGTPGVPPGHFDPGDPDDQATFDLGNTAAAVKQQLSYTCVRNP
jgi:hypothetical protein